MSSQPPPPPGDAHHQEPPTGAETPPESGGLTPYPSYAGGPPAYRGGVADVPAAPVPQPSSIRTAVLLMYLGAALSVIGLLVGLATLGSLRDNIRSRLQDNGTFTASQLDTAYHVAVVSIVVIALIAIGLWVWMAVKNGQGRSWARIVATVLGGLNILQFLINLAQSQSTAGSTVLSVISVLLAIAILVMLWRPESSAYFQATRAATRQQYR